MSDTKISALAVAPALAGNEEFPINQNGVSRKATTAQIRELANTLPEPVAIAAPATLNHDHYGKIVYVTTAGTITLPPAPQTTEVMRILNGSVPSGNVSVAVGTGSEVKVGAGKDVTFLSISSGWVRMQPAVEGGGTTSAPYIKGRFYSMSPTARLVSNSPSTAANTIYFQPFVLPNDLSVSALAVQVATAGVAGSTGTLAVYAANPANIQPTGTPVMVGTTPFAADTASVKPVDIGATSTLFGGAVYFFALNTSAIIKLFIDETSTAANLLGLNSASIGVGSGRSRRTSIGSVPVGTWPDMTSLPSYEDNAYFYGSFKAA